MEENENLEVTTEEQAIGNGETIVDSESIKTDIKKMEVAIEQLQAAGSDLFTEEIKNLQIKIVNAKVELENKLTAGTEEIKEIEQGFIQKYGAGAARVVEIVLLVIILYKLF